jgi:hypothetical protein
VISRGRSALVAAAAAMTAAAACAPLLDFGALEHRVQPATVDAGGDAEDDGLVGGRSAGDSAPGAEEGLPPETASADAASGDGGGASGDADATVTDAGDAVSLSPSNDAPEEPFDAMCPGADGACAPAVAPDPCAAVRAADNGTYCGSSNQSGFDPDAASPSALYDCQDGATVEETPCDAGCRVAPSGFADTCNPDPCAGVPTSANGYFCGSSTELGFDPGPANPRDLYGCQYGSTVTTLLCARGCFPAEAGQQDRCD